MIMPFNRDVKCSDKAHSVHSEVSTRKISTWLINCYYGISGLVDISIIEHSGSGVELWTLDYKYPGSNPGCGVKTLGKFFHSTLLQFTQLNKNEYLAIDSGGYVYEQSSRINCSIWLDASQRSRDGV